MRILFMVQGEGRGHLTQAISLGQILRSAGHEIVGAIVGSSPGRQIPKFFDEQILAPVHHFDAPNLIYNAQSGGMDLQKTIYTHLSNLPKYLKSLRSIHASILEIQPDLIISFYDTYGGLYNVIYRSKIPMVCVAHQFLLLHPRFIFPEKSAFNQFLINLNSRFTSWFSEKKLALSFRSMHSETHSNITVVPPLLRQEVIDLNATNGDYFLVYMTHHSLSQQIVSWHRQHPEIKLHCFWDNADAAEEFAFDQTLTFHRINSEKYLHMLANSRALVTTAGFESVCEAMYLGKPVMMVPVPNHFEQECNAIDGVISGAGITSKTFDLSVLLNYLSKHIDQSQKFRDWYNQGRVTFIKEIEAFDKKSADISHRKGLTSLS
ncbi:glycosyltransferase family protein [Dyadobacter sp. CY323]|uniref:glycosyltransferase family protein n=1 Tax=Dyadobacter sp. CY323 TaxID=2907302 RepID=UPI001F31C9D4|nr:glycosyltransferase family protein [Dyadobacter sp. CY323]MCE6990650.1 glycosyl transferase [Dyadobacter sp. CY323]